VDVVNWIERIPTPRRGITCNGCWRTCKTIARAWVRHGVDRDRHEARQTGLSANVNGSPAAGHATSLQQQRRPQAVTRATTATLLPHGCPWCVARSVAHRARLLTIWPPTSPGASRAAAAGRSPSIIAAVQVANGTRTSPITTSPEMTDVSGWHDRAGHPSRRDRGYFPRWDHWPC
jgi:hypothetical protein